MMSRRLVFTTSILATAILFFMLGVFQARNRDALRTASVDAKLDAIRSEVRTELGKSKRGDAVVPAGTSGRIASSKAAPDSGRASMVAEIKEQLQNEMGLLPVSLLRDRRSS